MTAQGPLAILSALAQEQQGLLEQLAGRQSVHYAGRDFQCGTLQGRPVVMALSRIGKVAAATTAAALISRFGINALVFTGVAGGVGEGVRVGDVVVGTSFLQHDMDASPLFPRYEVPLTGISAYPANGELSAALLQATRLALAGHNFQGREPQVHCGLLASGDRFVNGAAEVHALATAMLARGHAPLAVEMECAAVAQVCSDHGVPFAAVRTISDRADDTAHVDFLEFVDTVASGYATRILTRLLQAG